MKKKCIYCTSRMGRKVFVIFRTMKLLTVLIFTGSMGMAASTYSQETKIDLKVEDASLTEIFNTIEKNSEFIFVYNANVVNSRVKRSISVKNENIEKVLDLLFRGIDVVYRIDDRQVFLYKKEDLKKMQRLETEKIEMKGDQPQQKVIAGKVTDSEGLPLPGVSVVVKGTVIGTATGADGSFSLSVPLDAQTLQFSFVGMKTQEVAVGDQTIINVTMEQAVTELEEVVAVG